MSDEKILEMLKNQVDKTEIPEKFQPENINGILEGVEVEPVKKTNKVKRLVVALSVAAAVALVIIGGVFISNSFGSYITMTDNGFSQLSSYERLSGYLRLQDIKDGLSFDFSSAKDTASEDRFVIGTLGNAESATGTEHSDTNVRTEGVDESDCIKTDGKYIYTIAGDRLLIAKPDGADTKYINEISLGELVNLKDAEETYNDFNANDMMIYSDKLIILGNALKENEEYDCLVIIADISDIANVSLIQSFSIDGSYKECRMHGEYLYVSTKYEFENYKVDGITPEINNETLECKKVYFTDNDDYEAHYMISSYRITDKPELIDYVSVINDGYVQLYASTENIYVMSQKYTAREDILEILKFSYSDGIIEPKATRKISGWLEDVFCVDEYEGNLRIVITSMGNGQNVNSLYVLDGNLEEIGKISDIAPGESIYSARFNGDIGYFVTFEQVDPLFSVDLSDPENPEIIGKLKIPGFSEYMHFWEEGKMLGIGLENRQLKLSMFDISDPTNVTEEDKCILKNIYDSVALYNHRAAFIEPEKNIIGFPAYGSFYADYDVEYKMSYYIYSYENGEFVQKVEIIEDEYGNDESEYYEQYEYYDMRGMYIGDYIYVVSTGGEIKVLDINTFEHIAVCKI